MQMIKGHWHLLLITALVVALWQTSALVPLKIFVVFLHELSHAAAALLTGGEVVSLSVSPDQGGLTTTRGGSRFFILTAGYLGSLLMGLALLLIALRTQADRTFVALSGALMLGVAALYVRDLFALTFCLGTGAALLAASRYLPQAGCDLILRVIGLASLIYVPLDIFDDTIARASLRSDARMLAEYAGGGTVLWGGLWLVISLVVIVFCIRNLLGENSNLILKEPKQNS